jgi:1,4-dihydroxy-2-naphthoyl-CoA synthase
MTVLASTWGQREVDGVEDKRFEQIMVTTKAGIAEVTLNRPDRYNALGSRIVGELGDALEEIEGSGEVRAMVLTGAGDKAFCSGVDLKERTEMDADGRWTHNRALGAFAGHLARLQVPTIAASTDWPSAGVWRSSWRATSASLPRARGSRSPKWASA